MLFGAQFQGGGSRFQAALDILPGGIDRGQPRGDDRFLSFGCRKIEKVMVHLPIIGGDPVNLLDDVALHDRIDFLDQTILFQEVDVVVEFAGGQA